MNLTPSFVMKLAKLIKISTGILTVLSENGIRIDDYKYVTCYEEFVNMRRNRVKYHAAIRMIAEEQKVSERTIERVFRRLSKVIDD